MLNVMQFNPFCPLIPVTFSYFSRYIIRYTARKLYERVNSENRDAVCCPDLVESRVFPQCHSLFNSHKTAGLIINNFSIDKGMCCQRTFCQHSLSCQSQQACLSFGWMSLFWQKVIFPITHYNILINMNKMSYYVCDKVAISCMSV